MPFAYGLWAAVMAIASMAAPVSAGYLFALRPERAHYLLGEPVYLRMEGSLGRPPALEEGTTILVIRDPGGAERAYRPPLRFRAGPAGQGRPAKPDPRYARLIAEAGGWVFPRPGRYTLRLREPPRVEAGDTGSRGSAGFSREARPLSDTVSIEIASPSLPEDMRAFSLLSRAPGEYAFAVYLEGGDQLRSGMEVMREVAGFPNAYTGAAAFVLYSDWAQDFRARSGGAARPLNLAKALGFAHWGKSAGAYLPLRTAFRLRAAVNIMSVRDPGDPGIPLARASLAAFEDSLTPDERAILASF